MHIQILIFLGFAGVAVLLEESVSISTKYGAHKKTNGFDQRYGVSDSSQQLSYLMPKLFEKKRLLDILENPRVTLHVKTRLISCGGITKIEPSNLFAGGLMKDWAFDMDEPPASYGRK